MTGGRVVFSGLNICAIIDHAPGTVDIDTVCDPAADCNRPAIDPGSWLDKVFFHSDFDYYQLAGNLVTVPVTHAALAGKDGATSSTIPQLVYYGDARTTDILLLAHGLGYVPKYMIAYGGRRLPAGFKIQELTGCNRIVQHFATTSGIYLREFAFSGSSSQDLPAMSASYEVMAFTVPAADPALPLRGYDEASGVLQYGHGKVRSDAHYLRQVLAGESNFDFNLGATGMLGNGGCRFVSGGVATDDNGYSGSFAGPSYVPVGGVY